jgi:hypothetical protein
MAKSTKKGSSSTKAKKGITVAPRNPFVVHLQNKPSGPQDKPYKSKRKAEKQKGYEQ